LNLLAVVLALGASVVWGAGDFAGGLTTKQLPVWSVVIGSQSAGLLMMLVLALATGEPLPSVQTAGWAVAAGLAGAIGVAALYGALATGAMGLVAPISGVGAAGIPIAFGVLVGERPTMLQVAGMIAGLLAVGLASGPVKGGSNRGVGLAVIAAIGFGTLFVLFKQAGATSVFWPLVAARVGSVSVFTAWCSATGRPVLPPPSRAALLVALAGLLDMTANGLYILSTRQGLLSLVAVLSSLYPIGTAVLARVILDERLTRRQQLCAVMALGGAVLIASA
jgi:drug/metabolite transporter (DMT)-like permease